MIDFKAIAKQTGISRGRIFYSKTFKCWCVEGGKASITIIEPPKKDGIEPVRIHNNCWEY